MIRFQSMLNASAPNIIVGYNGVWHCRRSASDSKLQTANCKLQTAISRDPFFGRSMNIAIDCHHSICRMDSSIGFWNFGRPLKDQK
jgi:hypothetical protein